MMLTFGQPSSLMIQAVPADVGCFAKLEQALRGWLPSEVAMRVLVAGRGSRLRTFACAAFHGADLPRSHGLSARDR
jgi:hypothetical protein